MKTGITLKICFCILMLLCMSFMSGCKSLEVSEGEKALRVIEKDIDDFRADLRTLEMVRGKPLEREVFIALDNAKQAIIRKDYDAVLRQYGESLACVRDHLTGMNVVNEYIDALDGICKRLDEDKESESDYSKALNELRELAVKQRLKGIILPEFTVKPPATLIDVFDFFKQASRDYDDPEIPVEQRGVSLVLKLQASSSVTDEDLTEEDDPFAGPSTADVGVPFVGSISARFISLYDAMQLVCDVTGYEFDLRHGFVMIRPVGECDGDDE